MKKIAMILWVCLTVFVWSCEDSDSLDLGTQTKEENNGSTTGSSHPDAQKCMNALVNAENGWKMIYQPADYAYTILFDFSEDGLVNSDSKDFTETAYSALFDFANIDGKLAIKLQGDTQIGLVGTDYNESVLLVKEITDNKISCVGQKLGKNMDLVKATAEDKAALNQKVFWEKLSAKNLMYGVLRDNGMFAVRYGIDYKANKIDFVYIENNKAKYVQKTFSMNSSYTAIEWTPVVVEGESIEGLSYDEATLSFQLKGSTSLTLTSGLADNQIRTNYVGLGGGSGYQYEVNKSVGAYSAAFNSVFDWEGMSSIEFNYRDNWFAIVGCLKSPFGGYMFVQNTKVDSPFAHVYEVSGDKVFFTFMNYYPMSITGDQEVIKAEMKPLMDFYYNTDGLVVVQEVSGGRTWFYLIHPSNGEWIKTRRK